MARGGEEGDAEADEALARRVVAGELDLFERLVDRHAPRVRRIVARNVPRSAVAEVAHDAFVAAYLSLGSYAPSAPFERWLVRIALRTCADYWRERGRGAPTDAERDPDELAAGPEPDDDRELVEWALARLEREDREVLALVHLEGFGVKECADVLGWSESKVKVRAHRARSRLRELLRGLLREPERKERR